MSTKSNQSHTIKAVLVGAALAGLIAGATSAQASVGGASTDVSTKAFGDVVGNVVIKPLLVAGKHSCKGKKT
jgi:hypothetical protein